LFLGSANNNNNNQNNQSAAFLAIDVALYFTAYAMHDGIVVTGWAYNLISSSVFPVSSKLQSSSFEEQLL